MAVEIHPNNVLAFKRPLTQLVKRALIISNEQTAPVAFKVKTTAPKQYCVRPNAGRIEPGEKVEVQVLLQGLKEEPPADFKCKDKFLIQSALVVSEFEGLTLPELWTNLEKENKASIHEQKIRCAFLPADESPENPTDDKGAAEADTTGVSQYTTAGDQQRDSLSSSPSPQQNGQAVNGNAKPLSQVASDARSQPASETAAQAKDSVSATTIAAGSAAAGAAGVAGAALAAAPSKAKEAVSGTSNSAATATDGSSTELQKQLDAAKAEIERLKLQLKKAGVDAGSSGDSRTRSVAFKDEPSAALSQSIKEAQVEGVAFEKVVMISALVFIFTWLFF